MITICLTYFVSLTLANLAAALYSVRQQDVSRVAEIVILDNNTSDTPEAIQQIIDALQFPVPVRLVSVKHGDPTKTHAWSTNAAVREAATPWVFFTRADYILSFDALARSAAAATSPRQFVIGGYYDIGVDIQACETTSWRTDGPAVLHRYGREYGHTIIDSGVWYTSREAFDLVGGLDERLVSYGHAQTHFQHKLFVAGIEFVRLREILFHHPRHAYAFPKDLRTAHAELAAIGVNTADLWERYDGPNHPRYDREGVFHG